MGTAEIKTKTDELGQLMHEMEEKQLQFDMQTKDLNESIDKLKEELKEVFLQRKESMTSERLLVTYRKGAVKWETKWLEGYSLDHPEILKYRKMGNPTVAFKTYEGWDE